MSSSSTFSLLLILSLLPLLSSARPCKTILISYYSVTATSSSDPTTSRFFAFYRFRPINRTPVVNHRHHLALVNRHPVNDDIASSLQDRAKDILIVVVGLLFGLGCGAIAASTMFLVWSLLTNRSHIFGSEDEFEFESDEESPKKMGYVKIAPAPAPAATKEGVQRDL